MSVPICAVVVVFNEDAEVIVSSRRYDSSRLNLPGGKADPEDGDQARDLSMTMLRCAARELREETGLYVELDDLELLHCGVCVDEVGEEPNAINFTYFARRVSGTAHSPEGEPPIQWVPWDELLDHTPYRAYNVTVGALALARLSLGVK